MKINVVSMAVLLNAMMDELEKKENESLSIFMKTVAFKFVSEYKDAKQKLDKESFDYTGKTLARLQRTMT